MKKGYTILIFLFTLFACKKDIHKNTAINIDNEIKYAKGFSLQNYSSFSVLRISKPWPGATKVLKFVLVKKNGVVPDSLKSLKKITIPIKKIVATSTTHLPSIEMLNEEKTLIGFPHLDYISSELIRSCIAQNPIAELGNNQSMNAELLLGLKPDLVVGFGMDNNNLIYSQLEKFGISVIFNGDWNEQTPLGKAEWIKLFGALYDKQTRANNLFKEIENNYISIKTLAQKATKKPTVLCGDIYEGNWFLPSGESWMSQMLIDANANYLWKDTKGTGSLPLSFETVYEKGKFADFWFSSGQFTSFEEMKQSNIHYTKFDAFTKKKVYTFSLKKGAKGGVVFYELAPNRPDIVLKDLVKILHPELLPDYKTFFYSTLK